MIELLHILSDTNIGGAGRALRSFLDGFDTTGFRVRVALPKHSAMEAELAGLPIDCIALDCAGDRSFAADFLTASSALIRRVRPTILHTHASLSAQLAGICHRVPVRVATKHRVESEASLMRRLALPATGVRWIAVSGAVAEGLCAAGVSPSRVYTVPNGVAVPKNTDRSVNLRRELGISPAAVVYGMVGRVETEKGVRAFLYAAKQVGRALPDAHFLVVGTGSLLPELRQAAGERVHLLGHRTDMAAVYATLDVLVNASLTEAASMTLLEGMAAGVPVLASAVGGTPELLGDTCGRLFAPQNVGALADAMFAFADPTVRARAAAESRARVLSHFANTTAAARLRELYLDFCGVTNYSPLRAVPTFP